jgi:MoxR-like ATPase
MSSSTGTTMILEAEVVQQSAEDPRENYVRLRVPGDERSRLAYFPTTGYTPAAGERVDVRVSLQPAERVIVEEIARAGSLGERSQSRPRKQADLTLDPIPGPAPEDLPPGVEYVLPNGFHVPRPELTEYFRTMELMSRNGRAVKVEMIGPSGCGKTEEVREFAAAYNRPYAKNDMGTKLSADELLGFRDFKVDRTVYTASLLVRALATPRCVVHLDEITRLSPTAGGPLYPLLDHTGQVWSDYLQEYLYVDPSVIVVATSNRGVTFTGTFMSDEALDNRFVYPVEVGFPDAKIEAEILTRKCGVSDQIARALVEFAKKVREMCNPAASDAIERPISTRNLIAVADLIAHGLAPDAAIKLAILPRYSLEGGDSSPRIRIATLLQGRFGA